MAKRVLTGEALHSTLRSGAKILADTVGVTLGPSGRNVAIQRQGSSPLLTCDGVTVAVATEVSGTDNISLRMLKQAAKQVADDCGDGTTSTIVLGEALIGGMGKVIAAGANPAEVVKGMKLAAKCVREEIVSMSDDCVTREALGKVARISTKSETLGDIVADALIHSGKHGTISVEESNDSETRVEVTSGFTFPRGLISSLQLPEGESKVVLENCLVLVCSERLSDVGDVIPILEQVAATDMPLLIVAPDISGEALTLIVNNTQLGHIQAYVVMADKRGAAQEEWLADLAMYVGQIEGVSNFENNHIRQIDRLMLGMAPKVSIGTQETQILSGVYGKVLAKYAKGLMAQLDVVSDRGAERLRDRIALLTGGAVTIYVGAHSTLELEERKARLEDGLHACRIASQAGVSPGGGEALAYCAEEVGVCVQPECESGDQRLGWDIFMEACEVPLKAIVANSFGADPDVVAHELRMTDYWDVYCSSTHQYGDAYDLGILDPTAVVLGVLDSAVSVAGIVAMSGAALVEVN